MIAKHHLKKLQQIEVKALNAFPNIVKVREEMKSLKNIPGHEKTIKRVWDKFVLTIQEL
jgi:hypothetical protein